MRTTYQTYSLNEWQVIMDDFMSSGLTQAVFCEQQGLAASTFSKWRKQLGLAGRSGKKPVADFQPLMPASPSTPIPTIASAPSAAEWQVELTLGVGIVLRIQTVTL